eukprot:11166233-Lingulodinium_polyedra.AAC.1
MFAPLKPSIGNAVCRRAFGVVVRWRGEFLEFEDCVGVRAFQQSIVDGAPVRGQMFNTGVCRSRGHGSRWRQ